LADKELWARLGSRAPGYIVGVMLAGFSGTIEVSGTTFSGLIMPPQDRMSDEDLAAIGNYVLSTLNDSKEKVLTGDVAKLRAAPPTHAELRATRRTGH
jgi:mono/diheme cytochrome c family protein